MDKLKESVRLALAEYKKEYGEDVKIEDGEEFATVFRDGVLIIGFEAGNVTIKILQGKPYFIDRNLLTIE